MTDKLLLGILLYKSMTLYEMKKALEQTVGFFSTFSFGSIHPAIMKLAKSRLVKGKKSMENGRAKTIYTITNDGREAFKEWLDTTIYPGKIQDDGLIRVFFLTELPLERRYSILYDYINSLKDQRAILKTVQKQNNELQLSIPDEYRDTFNYRMACIDYGIKFYCLTIKWYTDFINKLQKGSE